MKKTLFLILIIIYSDYCYCQQDTITPKVIKLIENWCPIYVLENYCEEHGLTNIIKKINVDDRVSSIAKEVNTREPTQDSLIVIQYNNVTLSFENWGNDADYLHTFVIYFSNMDDLKMFALCYKYLMGFAEDDENENRFYYKGGGMNSVTINAYPEDNIYFATCFVFQSQYCK